MGKRGEQKVARIIGCALELLTESGDQGLTMRQVAARAGMSLSNVQYYFTNKDALLLGLLDFYLAETLAGMEAQLANAPTEGPDRFRTVIAQSFDNPELEPVCRVFKEIWAIAERNPVLHEHLMDYYRRYVALLTAELQGIQPDCPPERIDQAVSLILPTIEGYAITRDALPLDGPAMAALLTTQVLGLIGHRCGTDVG